MTVIAPKPKIVFRFQSRKNDLRNSSRVEANEKNQEIGRDELTPPGQNE